MDQTAAILQIKEACKQIALQLMRIHPAVPPLSDPSVKEELYKALYQITKEVEIIKKKVGRLSDAGDKDQPDL